MSPTARTPARRAKQASFIATISSRENAPALFNACMFAVDAMFPSPGRPQPHRVMRQSTVEPSGATHLRASCPFQMHAAREEQREALQTEDAGSTLYGCGGKPALSFPGRYAAVMARLRSLPSFGKMKQDGISGNFVVFSGERAA